MRTFKLPIKHKGFKRKILEARNIGRKIKHILNVQLGEEEFSVVEPMDKSIYFFEQERGTNLRGEEGTKGR